MPLALVIHDLPAGSTDLKVMYDAIYEISGEHWPATSGAVLVDTGVSPAYLRDHLVRSMTLRGVSPGTLLVTRLGEKAAWANLPKEGEAWLRGMLAE